MRKVSVLTILFLIVICLSSCSSAQTEKPTNDTQGANAEAISRSTLSEISESLEKYFEEYGDVCVTALDRDGALSISLKAEGMVSQVVFPDYVNALIVQSEELASEHDLSICDISVTFTADKDNMMNWNSGDCVSGTLVDNYYESKVFQTNVTVDGLVERYGATNWFYELLPEESSSEDGGA